MNGARILVRLLDGETVVHEYRGAGTNREGGIAQMIEDAMGWMQSYQGQVTNDQWRKDIASLLKRTYDA